MQSPNTPATCGTPRGRQAAVHLEDVAGAARAREGARLLRQEQARAVDQVDRGQPQAERHLLGALDLLGRPRPPRARRDRVVVGDDHAPAALDRCEGRDHAGGGGPEAAAELLAVVDEGADLEDARRRDRLSRSTRSRAVSLPLSWTRTTYLSPQPRCDLVATRPKPCVDRRERLAVLLEGAVVERRASADRRWVRAGRGPWYRAATLAHPRARRPPRHPGLGAPEAGAPSP